ncbi:MAG: hypothetical protein ABR589_00050 [Chthoniobacterales bacterium]
MNAIAKLARNVSGTPKVNRSGKSTGVREIRFASNGDARKAGKWAIKKYAGVFKKLAG